MNSKPGLKQPKPKSSLKPLYYLGMPVMILGIVSTTMFGVRQFEERTGGHTYYEFIVPGALLAVVGFVLLALGRRRVPPA